MSTSIWIWWASSIYTKKKFRHKSTDSYMGPCWCSLHLIQAVHKRDEERIYCKCNDISIKWTNQMQSAMVIGVDYGPILREIWNGDSFQCWTLWSIVWSVVRNRFFLSVHQLLYAILISVSIFGQRRVDPVKNSRRVASNRNLEKKTWYFYFIFSFDLHIAKKSAVIVLYQLCLNLDYNLCARKKNVFHVFE